MTYDSGTARKAIDVVELEASGLGTLLAALEDGVEVTLTREGLPIATVSPTQPDAVAEPPATYWAAPTTSTALQRLVGSAGARAVLAVFLTDPTRRLHQREIARTAGVGLRSAQLALERLESLGFIASERDGNRRYYSAVRSERFEAVRALLSREIGFVEVLERALGPFRPRIERAVIFGSAARGDDRVGSDLDLLVVGEVTSDDLVEALAQAQEELGREIDAVVYRTAEFNRRVASGNHFLTAVLAGTVIDIFGGTDGS